MASSKHKLILIALAVSGVVGAIAIARPIQNSQQPSGTGATYGFTEVAVVNQAPPVVKQTVPAEPEFVETPLEFDKSDDEPFIVPEFEAMEPGVTMPVGWSEEEGATEAITIAESVFENSIEIDPSPEVGSLLEASTPNPGSAMQPSVPALQLTHDRESPILESTPVFEPEPEVIPPPQVVQVQSTPQLQTVPQSQSTQQFQTLPQYEVTTGYQAVPQYQIGQPVHLNQPVPQSQSASQFQATPGSQAAPQYQIGQPVHLNQPAPQSQPARQFEVLPESQAAPQYKVGQPVHLNQPAPQSQPAPQFQVAPESQVVPQYQIGQPVHLNQPVPQSQPSRQFEVLPESQAAPQYEVGQPVHLNQPAPQSQPARQFEVLPESQAAPQYEVGQPVHLNAPATSINTASQFPSTEHSAFQPAWATPIQKEPVRMNPDLSLSPPPITGEALREYLPNQPGFGHPEYLPQYDPQVGHRSPQPVKRPNANPLDDGRKYSFETKKREYPPFGDIIATGRFFYSAEVLWAEPQFQGNTAITTEGVNFAESIPGDFDSDFHPRFRMGFESEYGPGIELNYFNINSNSEVSSFTSDGVITGQTSAAVIGRDVLSRIMADDAGEILSSQHSIDIDSFSVSFFKELKFPISRVNGNFGFQYVSVAQQLNANVVSAGATLETLQSTTDLRAFGPKAALEYYRPIGHTPFEFVTSFGGAVLFGQRDQFVTNSETGLVNRVGADEFLTIIDFLVAVQYTKTIGENRSWYGRFGFLNQTWIGGGNPAFTDGDFGLRGLTFGIGYNR